MRQLSMFNFSKVVTFVFDLSRVYSSNVELVNCQMNLSILTFRITYLNNVVKVGEFMK
jgi:hypothetical protein